MKKVFRLLVIVLAVVTAVSFSGCNRMSAYETYINAAEKVSELKGIDADIKFELSMSVAETTTKIPVELKIKAKDIDGDPEMSMAMSASFMGMELANDLYIKDNIVYLNSDGMKYKQEITDEYTEMFEITDIEKLNSELEITEEDFEKEIRKENGKTIITCTFPGEKLNELLDGLSGSGAGDMTGGLTDMDVYKDVELSDGKMTVTVDENGYITNLTISEGFSAKMDAGSDTLIDMSADINIDMTLNNPGGDVVITPPSDLSEYQEYSGESMEDGLFDDYL